MGTGYLLDTNVLIDFSSEKLPLKSKSKISGIIDSNTKISIISKIELLSLPHVSREIVEFTNGAIVIVLEEKVIEKTIEVRKKYRIKLPDAVIAATALVYHLTLITHNIRDFKNISRLKVIDSHLLA